MSHSTIRYILTWVAMALLLISGIWLLILSWNGILSGQPHHVWLISAWLLVCASGIFLFMLAVKKAHRQLVDETRAREVEAAEAREKSRERKKAAREESGLDFAATARKLVRRTPEESTLEEAGKILLKNLAGELEIMSAVFYIRKKDRFEVGATYALPGSGVPSRFREGEGLAGQVALNRELLVMTRLPEEHLKVCSGLGKARPAYLAIVPLVENDRTVALLECTGYRYDPDEIGKMFRILARDLMKKRSKKE